MNGDPRDYKLDIRGIEPKPSPPAGQKPFVGVQFNCCGVYQRIYRSDDGKQYEGRCPRCGRFIRFVVGPGGTDARTFVVD